MSILDPEAPATIVAYNLVSEGYSFPEDYSALVNMWLLDSDDKILHEVTPLPIWKQKTSDVGEPFYYSPKGDGSYLLTPPPDTTKGYKLKMVYYADLQLIAIDSAMHDTFLRKHRTMFIQGILAKALDDKNDTRADKADAKYQGYVKLAVSRERLGAEQEGNVPLQMRVVD